MPSLPTQGGNNGTWGDDLNTWLLVDHNSDGTNKTVVPTLSMPVPNIYNAGTTGTAGFSASGDVRGFDIWVPWEMTFNSYRAYITTSSGNLDIGVYSSDGATLINSLGGVASPGTGRRDFTISGGLTLSAGHYLIVITANNTTIRFRSGSSADNFQSYVQLGGSHYPLNAPLSLSDDTTGLFVPAMLRP